MNLAARAAQAGRDWRWRLLSAFLALLVVLGLLSFAASNFATWRSIKTLNEQRALSIARLVAADPRFADWVVTGEPAPDGPAQQAVERMIDDADVLYIVVTDVNGVRYTHASREEIGDRVSTDPSLPLSGHEVVDVERGTLGLSARAKVPLRAESGVIVGIVSVGIDMNTVRSSSLHVTAVLAIVGAVLSVLGSIAVVMLGRRVHRMTLGLELDEMADLLREHTAVLSGATLGLVAADPNGDVRIANDAAKTMLGPIATGIPVADSGLPEPVIASLVAPTIDPNPGLLVANDRILTARVMPVERNGHDLGRVVVLADRTDLDEMSRELESTTAFTDALRAQRHEYANRLHALSGMLALGRVDDAEQYLGALVGSKDLVEISDPFLAGLLAAKISKAGESGVELRISETTWTEGRLEHPLDAITVIGDLIDNAIRAAADGQRRPALVEVSLLTDGPDLLIHVIDSGNGIDPTAAEAIFEPGWTTKSDHDGAHGLGLSLARATARRHGGDVELLDRGSADNGAVFAAKLCDVVDTSELMEVTRDE